MYKYWVSVILREILLCGQTLKIFECLSAESSVCPPGSILRRITLTQYLYSYIFLERTISCYRYIQTRQNGMVLHCTCKVAPHAVPVWFLRMTILLDQTKRSNKNATTTSIKELSGSEGHNIYRTSEWRRYPLGHSFTLCVQSNNTAGYCMN